jgi:hypothetical protein
LHGLKANIFIADHKPNTSTMLTDTFNRMMNPLYPYAAFEKEFLNDELEGLIQSKEEKILMVFHILLKKNNGLLVVSNQRLIIYQTHSNSFFKSALGFGWSELKRAAIGSIPGVGELMQAKGRISYGLGTWKKILNPKGTKLKEAKEQQEFINRLADIFKLPDNLLMNTEEFTMIFQDHWSSFNQHIGGVRIVQSKLQFEPVAGTEINPEKTREYKALLKKKMSFFHEDIGFILASLFLPRRDLLKKRGWHLYFDGENMLLSKEQLEDPALEEVIQELQKINFFGFYPPEFNFEAASEQPWRAEAIGPPNTEPTSELLFLEEASYKRKKDRFLFKKSTILSLVEADELSTKIQGFLGRLKSEEWFSKVNKLYLCGGATSRLSILLAHVGPGEGTYDEWFWFFVGDLPQSYLNAKYFPTPAAALDFYFKELIKYNNAVLSNQDTGNNLPFMDQIQPEKSKELEASLPILHKYFLKVQLDILEVVKEQI